MRPSDRTIRDELRREAANVPIPGDMWQNISRRLDEEDARKKQKHLARSEQWRPAVVLAVAAGFFWFALIPALPGTRAVLPGDPPAAVASQQQYLVAGWNVQVQSDFLDARRTVQPVAFVEQPPAFHSVPQ